MVSEIYSYIDFWGHQAWRVVDRLLPMWRNDRQPFSFTTHVESVGYGYCGDIYVAGDFEPEGVLVNFTECTYTSTPSPIVPTPTSGDMTAFDSCKFIITVKRIFEQRILSCDGSGVSPTPEEPMEITDGMYRWLAVQLVSSIEDWGRLSWWFECDGMGLVDCDAPCEGDGEACSLSAMSAWVYAAGVSYREFGKFSFRVDRFTIKFKDKDGFVVPTTFSYKVFKPYLQEAARRYNIRH